MSLQQSISGHFSTPKFFVILTIHVAVLYSDTDTSALHEYRCTLIENGHKYCKLLIKGPQTVMFSNYVQSSCKPGPFFISVYRH